MAVRKDKHMARRLRCRNGCGRPRTAGVAVELVFQKDASPSAALLVSHGLGDLGLAELRQLKWARGARKLEGRKHVPADDLAEDPLGKEEVKGPAAQRLPIEEFQRAYAATRIEAPWILHLLRAYTVRGSYGVLIYEWDPGYIPFSRLDLVALGVTERVGNLLAKRVKDLIASLTKSGWRHDALLAENIWLDLRTGYLLLGGLEHVTRGFSVTALHDFWRSAASFYAQLGSSFVDLLGEPGAVAPFESLAAAKRMLPQIKKDLRWPRFNSGLKRPPPLVPLPSMPPAIGRDDEALLADYTRLVGGGKFGRVYCVAEQAKKEGCAWVRKESPLSRPASRSAFLAEYRYLLLLHPLPFVQEIKSAFILEDKAKETGVIISRRVEDAVPLGQFPLELLTEEAADQLAARVCGAIGALVDRGVSHGDLHQDNVLINVNTGAITIIDLGEAGSGPHPDAVHKSDYEAIFSSFLGLGAGEDDPIPSDIHRLFAARLWRCSPPAARALGTWQEWTPDT